MRNAIQRGSAKEKKQAKSAVCARPQLRDQKDPSRSRRTGASEDEIPRKECSDRSIHRPSTREMRDTRHDEKVARLIRTQQSSENLTQIATRRASSQHNLPAGTPARRRSSIQADTNDKHCSQHKEGRTGDVRAGRWSHRGQPEGSLTPGQEL